jgi:hypothetical protein
MQRMRSLALRPEAYAHVCSRMLTYAHVCSRMLTYVHICAQWRYGRRRRPVHRHAVRGRTPAAQPRSPHALICVSSYYYMCVLKLLCVSSYYCMCPHTTIYMSSHSNTCPLTRLHMCPHTAKYLPRIRQHSFIYEARDAEALYMCPHTAIYVLYMCPHTTILALYVSSYYYVYASIHLRGARRRGLLGARAPRQALMHSFRLRPKQLRATP